MAQGSTRFEYLEKSIDDYIIKQQKKISRANTTRDVKLSYSLNFGEKNTSKEILKTSKPRDWTNISAICVKWKDGKDSEPAFKSCFKRPTEKYVKNIDWLDSSIVQTETHSLVETTKEESPTPTAAGLFKGAVFYGGNFTISISWSSSSIVVEKQQTYKRIKRIFDSSDDDDSSPLT